MRYWVCITYMCSRYGNVLRCACYCAWTWFLFAESPCQNELVRRTDDRRVFHCGQRGHHRHHHDLHIHRTRPQSSHRKYRNIHTTKLAHKIMNTLLCSKNSFNIWVCLKREKILNAFFAPVLHEAKEACILCGYSFSGDTFICVAQVKI